MGAGAGAAREMLALATRLVKRIKKRIFDDCKLRRIFGKIE